MSGFEMSTPSTERAVRRRRQRRDTAAAADVEHGLMRLDACASEQGVAERTELAVVPVGVVDVVHRLATVPGLDLPLIDTHRSPLAESSVAAAP